MAHKMLITIFAKSIYNQSIGLVFYVSITRLLGQMSTKVIYVEYIINDLINGTTVGLSQVSM